jgi:hypothetical protein
MRFCLFFLVLAFNLTGQTVIEKAISANDHTRKKPLFEAIDAGFVGVTLEVQVNKAGYLVCGKNRFSEQYLTPLKSRIEAQNGWVYTDYINEFLIILDFQSDSNNCYKAFLSEIEPYHSIITYYENNKRVKRGIKLILTGNVPKNEILKSSLRYCTLDEQINKLNTEIESNFVSMATLNFKKIFDWKGEGSMPNMQYHGYSTYVKLAHKIGRTVRVKKTPENDNAFGIISEAGADFIEVEDIGGYLRYYRNKKSY